MIPSNNLRHILKSLASTYESLGSQFCRTKTGVQSGPDVFDESRFAMTFFNDFGSYRYIMQFQISSRTESS